MDQTFNSSAKFDSHLDDLEWESIEILREVVAQFANPALLYSVGKDSTVLLHLTQKAFAPAKIPFPLLHVDTGYKFPEMYRFRDLIAKNLGLKLIVHRNEIAIAEGVNPYDYGTKACCAKLKTEALLDAIRKYEIDAAIGGARRDEERSRSKERIFSFRDREGQWDPKNQRPELWKMWNGRIRPGESMRVFPLSNWTELDIWRYIAREKIAVVPLYFAENRTLLENQNGPILALDKVNNASDTKVHTTMCRFRTLGCIPCTAAVASHATTVDAIVEELKVARHSERATRAIDHDQDASMELKKKEGYF